MKSLKKISLLIFVFALITSCEYKYIEPAPVVVIDPTVPVSFTADIQPIFTSNCISCHAGSQSPDLTSANSFAALVTNATPATKYIDTATPSNSYLYQKLMGTQTTGSQMPLGGSPLAQSKTDLVLTWITQGAKNN